MSLCINYLRGYLEARVVCQWGAPTDPRGNRWPRLLKWRVLKLCLLSSCSAMESFAIWSDNIFIGFSIGQFSAERLTGFSCRRAGWTGVRTPRCHAPSILSVHGGGGPSPQRSGSMPTPRIQSRSFCSAWEGLIRPLHTGRSLLWEREKPFLEGEGLAV